MNQAITPEDLIKSLETDPNSQIQVTQNVTLRTNPAKHTLAKEYQRIPRAIVELFLKSHQKMTNTEDTLAYNQKADSYRKEVAAQINNIREDMEKLTSKWEIILAEMGHSIETNYNNTQTIQVQITAPEERDFYDLIETMDHLLVVMDNLWFAKEQSLEDKQRVTGHLVKAMAGLGANSERKAKALIRLRAMLRNPNREKEAVLETNE